MQRINKIWPKWEAMEILGEGGFGKVYKAKRSDIEHYSAIKVIQIPSNLSEVREMTSSGLSKDHLKSYYRKSVEEFTEEIKMMIKLKSVGNIVSIDDYEVVENEDGIGWTIFIRMELLTNIQDYLKNREGDVAEVKKMAIHVLRALETCHDLNIIHRDIKPANIFVTEFGDYKLGDFGISREVEKSNATLSQKGTKSYMAPEMIKMNHYGKDVDMYALGLTMYELLNHNRIPFLPPYPETYFPNDREEAMFRRLRGDMFPEIEGIGELNDIIQKACHPDPKMRYLSATDMKKAIMDVEEDEVIKPMVMEETYDKEKTIGQNEETYGKFSEPFLFDEVSSYNSQDDVTDIINTICDDFMKKEGIDLRNDRLAYARIEHKAKEVVVQLERSDSVRVEIPYIASNAKGALHVDITIHKKQKKSEFMFEDEDVKEELEPLQRRCPYCGKTTYLSFTKGYFCPHCDKVWTLEDNDVSSQLSNLIYKYFHGGNDQKLRFQCAQQMYLLDGNSAQVLARYGHVLGLEERRDEQLEMYLKAVELDSRDALIYNNLGSAYLIKGDYQKALTYSREAILKKDYESSEWNKTTYYSNYAISLELNNDSKNAFFQLQRAYIEGYPNCDKVIEIYGCGRSYCMNVVQRVLARYRSKFSKNCHYDQQSLQKAKASFGALNNAEMVMACQPQSLFSSAHDGMAISDYAIHFFDKQNYFTPLYTLYQANFTVVGKVVKMALNGKNYSFNVGKDAIIIASFLSELRDELQKGIR